MKIAHLLPYSAKFPLKKHNGRYEWVYRVAKLQAQAGHDVTIFAGPSLDEETNLKWETVENTGDNHHKNSALLEKAFADESFDIFHSHFDYLHYQFADKISKPVIFTQHWFPYKEVGEAAKLNAKKNVWAVPASHQMLEADKELGIQTTDIVRQGIDLDFFHFEPEPSTDRLVFVGRIAPHKGVREAVEFALAAGQNLDIIGKINPSDAGYWQEIEPQVDGEQIRYLGPKSHEQVASIFSNAKAFLFPSQAPEACPQAPIEAQACGTPVIMSTVGASSEWLEHGKTGFVCSNKQEFVNAINQLDSLSRSDCRKFAENFDINKLLEKYDSLYAALIG